jgi:hypothetical protein
MYLSSAYYKKAGAYILPFVLSKEKNYM